MDLRCPDFSSSVSSLDRWSGKYRSIYILYSWTAVAFSQKGIERDSTGWKYINRCSTFLVKSQDEGSERRVRTKGLRSRRRHSACIVQVVVSINAQLFIAATKVTFFWVNIKLVRSNKMYMNVHLIISINKHHSTFVTLPAPFSSMSEGTDEAHTEVSLRVNLEKGIFHSAMFLASALKRGRHPLKT